MDWDVEDSEQMARRLPRLSQIFQLTDRAERHRLNSAALELMLAQRGQSEEEFCAEFGLEVKQS
jgi:hypothetical protein